MLSPFLFTMTANYRTNFLSLQKELDSSILCNKCQLNQLYYNFSIFLMPLL